MPEITADLTVHAPADAVWAVIGPGFAHIGEWATVIPSSQPFAAAPLGAAAVGAPVVGRVCRTGVSLAPELTETLLAYDDEHRTLTYQGGGLPRFVTLARNTWTVTPIGPDRCVVSMRAQFKTRGLLGLLGGWLMLAQVRRNSRHLADDLSHYVVTGAPSPRKQRQLRRASR